MALPEVTEEPHHEFSSFRVRGKIFVTVPPDEEYIHIFVSEEQREQALDRYSEFLEELYWGRKVVGLRASLAEARPDALKALITAAWQFKAPKSLDSSIIHSESKCQPRGKSEPKPRNK